MMVILRLLLFVESGRSIYFIATTITNFWSKDEVEAMVKVIGQVESESCL